MTRTRAGRGLVLGACLLGFAVSACSPDDPRPPPPPATSETPTETAQEREERVAYEAAEKSYREFRAEYRRVLNAGGSTRPTVLMTQTAGGAYLEEAVGVLEAYHGLKQHSSGAGRVVYVHTAGYSSHSLVLNVCEDTREVRIFNQADKLIGQGEQREAEIEVRQKNGAWKLWSGKGRRVASCEE